jgi:hypothetical protein
MRTGVAMLQSFDEAPGAEAGSISTWLALSCSRQASKAGCGAAEGAPGGEDGDGAANGVAADSVGAENSVGRTGGKGC